MTARGVPSRGVRAAFAGTLVVALITISAYTPSISKAAQPVVASAADADLRQLERRARGGDKQAQLELGVRFEEGRDGAPDAEKAARLYRQNLAGSRFQTQFVPSGGGVRPENTAIGEPPIWPRSYSDVKRYHPSRIAALLRWCRLQRQSGTPSECGAGKLDRLRRLAQFEGNFLLCRHRTNLGNAGGSGPYSFDFIPTETDRRMATRQCTLDAPVPDRISSDQSRLIWTMWLALDRHDSCSGTAKCNRADVRRQFSNALRTYREDSLLWFAMREALRRDPSMEDQVGDSWWWHVCNFASPDEPRIEATTAETAICNLIDTLVQTG